MRSKRFRYCRRCLGVGLGALAAGWIYSNEASRLPWVYGLSCGLALMVLGYLFWLPLRAEEIATAEQMTGAAEEVV